MNKTPSEMTLDELEDAIGDAREYLGEILTQFRSECALYGDAGFGQADNVARARAGLAELNAELNTRLAV